jgi:hypothetical protein
MVVYLIGSTTMVVQTAQAFIAIAHRVVWCTLATVDRHGRPRSRIVHPIWEQAGDGLVGWVVTRPTPLKRAHLAHSPYVSCSYWDAAHDVATAECRAEWVPDVATRAHAWDLFRAAPPPLGHDPAAIFPEGPGAEGSAVLRLEPWRLRAADVETLAGGRPALVWRAPETRAAVPGPNPTRVAVRGRRTAGR